MGLIGNLLSGKKAPPPPKELALAAGATLSIADALRARFPKLANASDEFLEKLPALLEVEGRWLDEATGLAGDRAGVYDDIFAGGGADILSAAVRDTLLAGGRTRQEEEALLASDAAQIGIDNQLQILRDGLRRRGIVGGGGTADSEHLAAQIGASRGAAENAARLGERRYGEQLRLNSGAPLAMKIGDMSIDNAAKAATLASTATASEAKLPGFTHQLIADEGAFGAGLGSVYSTASDLYSTSYNAALAKAGLDNKRKQNIFGNLLRLGTLAAGAINPAAAAGAAGATPPGPGTPTGGALLPPLS